MQTIVPSFHWGDVMQRVLAALAVLVALAASIGVYVLTAMPAVTCVGHGSC